MLRIERHAISVTTDADGAGTTTYDRPLNGYAIETRYAGSTFAGTASYTITRTDAEGGTVLGFTATANPWQVSPRQAIHTEAGVALAAATGGSALRDKIPVDGYVRLVVANGGSVVTDSIDLYVER